MVNIISVWHLKFLERAKKFEITSDTCTCTYTCKLSIRVRSDHLVNYVEAICA